MTTEEENIDEPINDMLFNYQLIEMELLDFEICSKRAFKLDALGFEIGVTHNISQTGVLKVEVKVSIIENDYSLSGTTIACVFKLDNYNEWLGLKGFEVGVLPSQFANLVNGISISTLRGVMFTKLQNTFLSSVILPIVTLSTLEAE